MTNDGTAAVTEFEVLKDEKILGEVEGVIPGSDKSLFSKEQSEQMWTGAVITPVPHYPSEFAVAQPHYNLYALGWDLSDYRGALGGVCVRLKSKDR